MGQVKFDVILADPPWHFRNYSADAPGMLHNRARGANRHYPTMTTKDIALLDIPAKDNAALFLWACWPLLPDALEVMQGWGFDYKSLAWVWVKAKRSGFGFFTGMGYYTRANSEPCLLGIRGTLPAKAARDVLAVIYSPVREHSRKPDEQYGKIERLYPEARKLELFARRPREGWSVWGNEVISDVELEVAEKDLG